MSADSVGAKRPETHTCLTRVTTLFLASVCDVQLVPRDDLVAPMREGLTQRAHLERLVLVSHVADQPIDALTG